ncbi:MAG TPA: hypothetical protein VKN64_00060 [Halanaerobiales bacterium]|nr:hypothetical protein [Halanaerobiales bacterium]
MMEKGIWTFGGSFDLGGNLSYTGEPTLEPDKVSTGFTVMAEYAMPAKNSVSYGAGFAYQLSRSLEEFSEVSFSFTPIYGLLKYHMENQAYLVGHAGYNLLSGSDAFKMSEGGAAKLGGGLYYAAGLGIGMENYTAEILYTVNNGTWETSEVKYDLSYSKFSLAFGYQF